MGKLAGKVAIVTGGASGIGAGIVTMFAEEGAKVVIADINEERGKKLQNELTTRGFNIHFLKADVSEKGDVVRYIEETISTYGEINIMVNNASIIHQANIVDTNEEDWEKVIKTNLTSCFLGSKYASQVMIKQNKGGRIINLSSIHATVSEPACSAYVAAKGGVESFTKTLASELAPYKVTANCLSPGTTYTELTRPMYTPNVKEALFKRVPLKAIAEPKDIACGALFLASDEAWYMTGSVLNIDGGYVMDGSLPDAQYWEE